MDEQNSQVTNEETRQTEQTDEAIQENVDKDVTQKVEERALEAPTSDVNAQKDISNPEENKNVTEDPPVVSEEIQKKLDRLKEYEVKENELNELKQRLGVQNTQDNVAFQAQQELTMFENQAQQAYITLCNKYGVDYRPDKIDESGKALLEKDPQAYYQLKYELDQLVNNVNNQRSQVENFIANREINLAIERNRQILDASPAIKTHIGNLLRDGMIGYQDIDNVINIGTDIAREAYEMGRQAAMQEVNKANPANILNDNVISQQNATPTVQNNTLTLADIEKMDIKTYAKNAALIDKLYAEGKLR